MAIALNSQSLTLSGGGGTNSMSIPAPAGLNNTMLDLMLAVIRDSNGNSVMTVGTDGGSYTPIQGANLNADGSIYADFTLRQKVGAASPGALGITWTSYSRRFIGARMAWSGVDLGAPLDAQSASLTTANVNQSGAATLTVPGITTVTDGALVLAYFITSGTGLFSTPSGWTMVLNELAYDGSTTICAAIFSKEMPTAGASGNAASVHAQSGAVFSYYNWAGGMVALKPDASPPPVVSVIGTRFLGL